MSALRTLDTAGERALVGGKGANLGRLLAAGFPVPDARILPVDAFEQHVAACRAAGADDDAALSAAIVERPLDDALVSALRQTVEELGGRVSVRSSATLEDAHTHAFAGQFLTVLNVGPEAVANAVTRVWASVFSDNVRGYLELAGLDRSALQMAVVIQRQLDSQASGVVLGDGDRAKIEAVFGQGEAVVSAEVLSDSWDVQNGRIVAMSAARKGWRLALPDGGPTGGLERVELSDEVRDRASLSGQQVLEVAELAGRLSVAFQGRPQDCEFTFVDDQLFVLQTRDVTASIPVEPPPLEPWDPPGKGAWELDDNHFSRPVTRLFADRFSEAMKRGFCRATARYGVLLSHIDLRTVNGFVYSRIRPVAAPEDATTKDPPPRIVFRLMCKLVPELRRRIATAEKLWQTRVWREQLAEWETAKKASIDTHLRLQRVDRTALDDAALIEHLRAAYAHAGRMVEQHHTYNFAALVPAGDLLAHAERWSNGRLSPADVLGLLAGSSDASADLRSPQAQALARAVADSDEARALLRLDETDPRVTDIAAAQALESLCAIEGELGTRAREFLEHREYRLLEGLDPASPCFREAPALLWRTVRDAARLADARQDAAGAHRADVQRCLREIPTPHHAEFDALLAEARSTYHLRDERALYSDVWAWGILRSVCLEIGARLHRRKPSQVVEPADAIHASEAELSALLLEGGGPSAHQLQLRDAFHRAYTVRDAPSTLGPAPKPPPPSDWLPPGAARLNEAIMTLIGHMFVSRGDAPPAETTVLTGRPASGGVYEGEAHVVRDARDVASLSPGSVLVVGAGSSSFTMLAPLASAVIAEGGGLVSHVAIVCREYRISCVTGCVGAFARIQTGDRVRVDGTQGRVTLLGGDAPAATS